MREQSYYPRPKSTSKKTNEPSNTIITGISLATDYQSDIKEALYEAYCYSLTNPMGDVVLTADDRVITISCKLTPIPQNSIG